MARALPVATVMIAVATVTLRVPLAQADPPGDHYLCYKVSRGPQQAPFKATQRTLEDQFRRATVQVKRWVSLCNPAQKNTEPPPNHPDVHEVGYAIAPTPTQPKFVASTHRAVDQFGSHSLVLVKPDGLLASSAKALGAGGTGTVDTTGVDHFTCYRTATPSGAPKFTPIAGVRVTDQFGSAVYDLKRIAHLCAPVNENGEDPGAPQHLGHLVCYVAARARPPQTVSINNANFGAAVLVTGAVTELCVPALKDNGGCGGAPQCGGPCPLPDEICANALHAFPGSGSGTCDCVRCPPGDCLCVDGSCPCPPGYVCQGNLGTTQCVSEGCAAQPEPPCASGGTCVTFRSACGASDDPSCGGVCEGGLTCHLVKSPTTCGCF